MLQSDLCPRLQGPRQPRKALLEIQFHGQNKDKKPWFPGEGLALLADPGPTLQPPPSDREGLSLAVTLPTHPNTHTELLRASELLRIQRNGGRETCQQ